MVRSWVELSVYVPVAVNCCVVPRAMLGVAGVTAIDTKVAAVTVSTTDGELIEPRVAVILLVPALSADASPAELMIATVAVADDQDTSADRSWVDWSENRPVALNAWLVPAAMLGFVGVTWADTKVAGVTVTVLDPAIL